MTEFREKTGQAYELLNDLLSLLDEQKERNWSRGIRAALRELSGISGTVNADGFENAQSIYHAMVTGGRGFAEYYVWSESEVDRIEANKRLDNLRSKIWNIFSV